MTTLDVRDLSVEAGGKTVVERPQLHAARRRQDGRRRAQRRRQDQPAEGARRARTRRSSGTVDAHAARSATCDRIPASTGPTTTSRASSTSWPPAIWSTCARRLEKARIQLEESHADTNIARFARLEEEYRELGGYAAESEARTITAGLGLANDRLALPVRALSGGERRRLELARILFGGSDLLMLDEPTNHLDADAKHWLMKFLASYRGALIVVSHDIELLDASITRILHLDRDQVVEYRGTYSQYREARAEDENRLTSLAGRQEQEIRRLKTLADSMRGQTAKRARKAKTLDTRVEKLRRTQGRRARRASERCGSGSPSRRTAARSLRSTTSRRATAGRRCSRTSLRRGPRRAAPDHGPERRGQDEPAAGSWRARPRRTPARSRSGTG